MKHAAWHYKGGSPPALHSPPHLLRACCALDAASVKNTNGPGLQQGRGTMDKEVTREV